MITVYLAFAPSGDKQLLKKITIAEQSTVKEAVALTDWATSFPEFSGYNVGIFSHKVTWDTVLKDGDRVEIYRPLIIDPMQKRQRKMQIAKNKRA